MRPKSELWELIVYKELIESIRVLCQNNEDNDFAWKVLDWIEDSGVEEE